MPSNSLPDADFSLPEMKTKSPSCPSGRVHMYVYLEVLSYHYGEYEIKRVVCTLIIGQCLEMEACNIKNL